MFAPPQSLGHGSSSSNNSNDNSTRTISTKITFHHSIMAAEFVQVGEVSGINFYPLKSCKGIPTEEAECDEFGIKYDRHWVVLDRGGRFTSQRSRGELALVVPTMMEGHIKVEAPGMEPLSIPIEMKDSDAQQVDIDIFGLVGSGVRVSEEADAWFSKYLGKPHSFHAFNRATCQPRSLHLDKNYGNRPAVTQSDKVAYSDKCPYLVISEGSLEKVNEICTKFECEMQRFRPNIVVKGCEAFAEDKWKALKIGSAEFRCLHMCGRCTLPNVDPKTGKRDKEEPLKSLRKFRLVPKEEDDALGNSPALGMNLGIEKPGIIKVGEPVFAKF